MAANDSKSRLKTAALALLGGYWPLMFVSTHLSSQNRLIASLGASDKLLHFGAYACLAFLLALNWWQRRAFGWRQWLGVWALAAAYGAFDEISQIPVGRSCDIFDWLSDLAGGAIGLASFLASLALWLPRRESENSRVSSNGPDRRIARLSSSQSADGNRPG
jgi:VanZ family protein